MKNIDKIRKTLLLIESQVDSKTRKLTEAPTGELDLKELKRLAELHFSLEKKLEDLADQMAAAEEEKEATYNSIFAAVNKVKGKTVKLGRIILKIKSSNIFNKEKSRTEWKNVLAQLQQAIAIEEKILTPIISANTKVTPASTDKTKELYITKESVEARALVQFIEKASGKKVKFVDKLNEGWLTDLGSRMITALRQFFSQFAEKVDTLESSVIKLLGETA